MVETAGLEPTTFWLQTRRSTAELCPHIWRYFIASIGKVDLIGKYLCAKIIATQAQQIGGGKVYCGGAKNIGQ